MYAMPCTSINKANNNISERTIILYSNTIGSFVKRHNAGKSKYLFMKWNNGINNHGVVSSESNNYSKITIW